MGRTSSIRTPSLVWIGGRTLHGDRRQKQGCLFVFCMFVTLEMGVARMARPEVQPFNEV